MLMFNQVNPQNVAFGQSDSSEALLTLDLSDAKHLMLMLQ